MPRCNHCEFETPADGTLRLSCPNCGEAYEPKARDVRNGGGGTVAFNDPSDYSGGRGSSEPYSAGSEALSGSGASPEQLLGGSTGDSSRTPPSSTGSRDEPQGEPDFTFVFGGEYVSNPLTPGGPSDYDDIALEDSVGAMPSDASDVTIKSGSGGPSAGVPGSGPSTRPEATLVAGSGAGESDDDSSMPEVPPEPEPPQRPEATQVIDFNKPLQGHAGGATMQFGAGGSNRADSDPYDSSLVPEDSSGPKGDAPTIAPGSGTMAIGSGQKSDGVRTPSSRHIPGLSSDRTVPHTPLSEGRGASSLKPIESRSLGPEDVRLRSYQLGDGTTTPPNDAAGSGPLDYVVKSKLGEGGMGLVERAHQASMNRTVAIKRIRPDKEGREKDRNQFVSEAVITGQLEHPNIIPIHDLGVAANGAPFYTMKCVDGEDWDKKLPTLTEEENLSALLQVAQAIAFAHSRNVIHMDLKPGNIRLGDYGEVLVMDFGLAARLDDGATIQPGGTPAYMAPELALPFAEKYLGKPLDDDETKSIRCAPGKYTDVYLLGAILFEIVSGRPPHKGKDQPEKVLNA
ncbi:MAG: serine/threonine-protein kinase, partial [Lacipirellulaceae bacterium]